MNKMVLKYCFICLVFFGFVITANGEVYKCTDKNGVIHFSDRPPPPEYLQGATQSGGVQNKEDGSDQAYQEIRAQKTILGSTKAEVIEMFKGWNRSYTYESKIDPNAIKFENKDLIAVIDFDKEKRAEGVAFLSISGLDDWTGKKSYVNKNYEKLLYWATSGKRTKIDRNKSTQYPVEVYIGNIHEDEETETVIIEKGLHQSQQSIAKKKFAQDLVASVPAIINAWWSQDISLWVEIDITTFASDPKLYAQQIADKLSMAAAIKFGHYLCVRVYYGEQRVLAKSYSSP